MTPEAIVGEPLVPDQWLEEVEQRLRRRFRQIPETAQFATYVQPPMWYAVNGLDRQIPATAVFLVRIPSPRDRSSGADSAEYSDAHRGIMLTAKAGELKAMWDKRVRHHAHFVGAPDPLEGAFEVILRDLASKHQNMRQLLG